MSIKKEILSSIIENRNQEVLNVLYKSVLPKVKNYVLNNNGNTEDAKDVFQDAVISFFYAVKSSKFKTEESIDGFIYTIARNAWINKVRKSRKIIYNEDVVEQEEKAENNPLDDIITRERQVAFQKVFLKLGSQCKEIMKLAIYENMPPREIMKELNITSIEVTRTNLYRCRKKLTELVLANKQNLAPSE